LALCLFITACSGANENAPSILSGAQTVRQIKDSGRFSGDFYSGLRVEIFGGHGISEWFTTYANTALGMIYRFDEARESDRLFLGARVSGLMEAEEAVAGCCHWYIERFDMRVTDRSGETWVRDQADQYMESLVRKFQWSDRWLRDYFGENFEERLAGLVEAAEDGRERWFGVHNFVEMEFWPVEVEIAGRVFKGLQINTLDFRYIELDVAPWAGMTPWGTAVGFRFSDILMESGIRSGVTYLFHQMDDVAIVITVTSPGWASDAVNRHISRIDVIS